MRVRRRRRWPAEANKDNGSFTAAYTYDANGGYNSLWAGNGDAVSTTEFTRDKLGCITAKRERLGGVTTTYVYGYGPAGRLKTAWDDTLTATS